MMTGGHISGDDKKKKAWFGIILGLHDTQQNPSVKITLQSFYMSPQRVLNEH